VVTNSISIPTGKKGKNPVAGDDQGGRARKGKSSLAGKTVSSSGRLYESQEQNTEGTLTRQMVSKNSLIKGGVFENEQKKKSRLELCTRWRRGELPHGTGRWI